MNCPDCNGEKEVKIFPKLVNGKVICVMPCERCNQTGTVPDIQEIWIHLGKSMRKDRIQRKQTLRNAAKVLGISVLHLSQAERGIIDPTRLNIPDDA